MSKINGMVDELSEKMITGFVEHSKREAGVVFK